ncbi:MAG: hypothetical protein RIM80_26275, partial [Alphaproteobacteria bacterium]
MVAAASAPVEKVLVPEHGAETVVARIGRQAKCRHVANFGNLRPMGSRPETQAAASALPPLPGGLYA